MLAASLVLAGALALSIHVGMLASGVPMPSSQPPDWARWLNLSLGAGTVLVFLGLAEPHLRHRSMLARTLITFVILLTIRETMRAAIMTGVVTTGWTFAALGVLEPLARLLVLALLCVIGARWVRGAGSLILIALVTGALHLGAQALLGAIFAPLRDFAAAFSHPDLYQFPYPAQVLVPAYLTFIEAVTGATLLLALVWNQLPGNTSARLLCSALLVALLKGIVAPTFLFSFFSQQPPLASMLSFSQFLLEFLALGLLAGLAWDKFGPH